MTSSNDVKWRKILYRRQPYPDNYSGGDEQFLSELKKNCKFSARFLCLETIPYSVGADRTLTDTISTDTIFALSFITALISCVFHDYGINAPIVSYQLSVSSGLSSAVFLLSRLDSNDVAFVMLSIAFALHAFTPFIR
ncbi:phosphatidylinositol N-acetylglucosaminyltransferase [Necator americanus]|uniref:Phosphatidylinositol N-acetylglucosaminyltransferase n=1 Tax=Necator americanus TaxID=51031 RepID=W2SLL0_NECAM|nr:phosphatidylinositol N-acetylglucosaminyltransferase [Necator americanus]ETN69622.1 phosphatidylinositol N-acetylglucosaminyltransferase [Necator americanus]